MSTTVPTPEELLELEAKHKRIGVVTHPDGQTWCLVLRKPTRAEYKRFRDWSTNPQRQGDAQEQIVKDTRVWPVDAAAFNALLEEWPGIPEACGKMIMALAGMAGVEQGKY